MQAASWRSSWQVLEPNGESDVCARVYARSAGNPKDGGSFAFVKDVLNLSAEPQRDPWQEIAEPPHRHGP